MADAIISRLGQINKTGDATALFLKVYGGEVMTAFEEANAFVQHHKVRTIKNGKSAQFPVMGRSSASYHTPGAQILGGQLAHAERVVSIDELLIDPKFIGNIDEAMNHYDVRAEYTTQQGRSLAKSFDLNVAGVGILAARAAATITGEAGGSALTDATFSTSGSALVAGLWTAAQTLDEKFVPEMDRACFLRPAQYYLVNQNTTVLNKDWGGSGSYSEGGKLKVAGIEIVKALHLPSTNLTADTTVSPSARADYTNTYGLVMHKDAVGTVKLMDLAIEHEYQVSRQGTLMVAKFAMGHGILRPECSIEFKVA